MVGGSFYLAIVTEAFRGKPTVYPAPLSRKIVAAFLPRRGAEVAVSVKSAELAPPAMVTCGGPERLYIFALAVPPVIKFTVTGELLGLEIDTVKVAV